MLDIAIVAVYLLATVAWGFDKARRLKAGADFNGVSSRQGPFLVFASLTASFLGGGFSIGLASRVYSGGIGHVLALWGFSAGTVLVGLVIAPRLQRFRGCGSVGSLMGMAYGPSAQATVGMLAALFCCAVFGAQLRALGLLLQAWLGLDFRAGAAVGCAVLVVLCAVGGSQAVVTAAPIQFALLLCGFALMLALGVARAGGFAGLVQTVPQQRLQPFSDLTPLMVSGSFLLFMTGETLAPPYVGRLLTGRDGQSARAGGLAAGLFSMVLFLLCGLVGLTASAIFPQLNAELAMPTVLARVLPGGLRGLAAAGVLAGLTAAGAAFLSAAVSNLTLDVLPPILPMSGGVAAGRAATVAFGLISLSVAVFSQGVLEALAVAYRLWAPAVAVPLVAAAFGKRAGPMAFWCMALSGLAGMVLWECIGNPFALPSPVFGILLSAVVCLLLPQAKTNGRVVFHNGQDR